MDWGGRVPILINPLRIIFRGILIHADNDQISSEGRGPEPSYILVHPSLFCLATPLVVEYWKGHLKNTLRLKGRLCWSAIGIFYSKTVNLLTKFIYISGSFPLFT